jgi:predicted ArsR family transcriptional regulator
MLEPILGSTRRDRVLALLRARGKGQAGEMARFVDTDLVQIQKQPERLEAAGIIVGRPAGRTRLYTFNPR